MTITIMTSTTITFNDIKPSFSNMSNIRKSVANIQHTKHIRSAIAAMLITYDKHPLIMVWFSVYKLTPNLFKAIGVTKYINPKIHSEGSFHVLYDKLDKLVRQCQAVNSHLQICES